MVEFGAGEDARAPRAEGRSAAFQAASRAQRARSSNALSRVGADEDVRAPRTEDVRAPRLGGRSAAFQAASCAQRGSAISDVKAIIEPFGLTRFRCVTFAELEQHTNSLAALLLRRGLKQGDAVLILHPMSIELYEFLIALFKIGAVALFIDPTFGSKYIKRAFELCRPVGSFTGGKAALLTVVEPELRAIPLRFSPALLSLSRLLGDLSDDTAFNTVDLSPDAPALITFTSGSTGKPKAIVRSHGFLQHQLDVLKDTLQLHPGQVDLTSLPIFLLGNIASGVTSVIPDTNQRRPSQVNGSRIMRQIERHNVTRICAPPALLKRLCQAASRADRKVLSLRQIYTGGGPVFPDLLLDLQQIAPASSIHILYGSTEAEPIASISFSDIHAADML
ncbi:MAG: AMP-binding protein, partial [Terriglobales bacterium]